MDEGKRGCLQTRVKDPPPPPHPPTPAASLGPLQRPEEVAVPGPAAGGPAAGARRTERDLAPLHPARHRVRARPFRSASPSSQPAAPAVPEGACEVHLQGKQQPPDRLAHSLPASPSAAGARGIRFGGPSRSKFPSREGDAPRKARKKGSALTCRQSWEGSEHARDQAVRAAPRPAPEARSRGTLLSSGWCRSTPFPAHLLGDCCSSLTPKEGSPRWTVSAQHRVFLGPCPAGRPPSGPLP